MRESVIPDFFGGAPTPPPAKVRSRQSLLGQYLTPPGVAAFMAGLFPELPPSVRLLDAGAGAGALTAAFVRRWRAEAGVGGGIVAYAYELDSTMAADLRQVADGLGGLVGIEARVVEGDFIRHAATMIRLRTGPRYTHAILNPPYKKIGTASEHRALLRAAGLETVNLYSGFVGLAVGLMEEGGEVVAIIPRSFCNGPYYQPFRRFILARTALRHIHLFGARDKAFEDDGVLQGNIVIRLTRGAPQGAVTVSTSTDATFSDYAEASHPFDATVPPDDAEQFIRIPTREAEGLLESSAFRFSLNDLGVSVSTGPVVDFRLRE